MDVLVHEIHDWGLSAFEVQPQGHTAGSCAFRDAYPAQCKCIDGYWVPVSVPQVGAKGKKTRCAAAEVGVRVEDEGRLA